jgi:hypothetical protein
LVVLLQELTPLLSNTKVRFTSSVDMEDWATPVLLSTISTASI